MKQNNSPWLTQLHPDRATQSLEKDTTVDVVIIGGGIAGITTLYYLLKHTDKKIILLEANKIAHGATGHNAGQIVAEFEKPLADLVKEYGVKKAVAGLGDVESAWELLLEILEDTGIDIPFREFIGYGGYSEQQQLIADLETESIKFAHGLMTFPAMVSRESGWMKNIPQKFHEICVEVDADAVRRALGITAQEFHAALPQKKGTMNSALFSEKLALWCVEHFPKRANIFEQSSVHGIEIGSEQVLAITNEAKVSCDEIVLCTNGFENFFIHDREGISIDTKFHHLVRGSVGYMTGYMTSQVLDPLANYFYEKGKIRSSDPFASDPYCYVTQRKFGEESNPEHLFVIGGPENPLEEREVYFREFDVDERFNQEAVRFAENHFNLSGFDKKFFWHGLMGYTRTGVRLVGREPLDERLMYNLGCNGVGILPSIMGARKIAGHVAGEKMPETIFDPRR